MSATIHQQATTQFETSSIKHASYPTNLIYCSSNKRVHLEAYKSRLDRTSTKLFRPDISRDPCDVRFRDFNVATGKFDETAPKKLHNLQKLEEYLGNEFTDTSAKLDKPDPKCRYVSIYSNKNGLILQTSKSMITKLLSFHQVMPSYLRFISVFGRQLDKSAGIRFSGFHEQSTLAVPLSKRPAVPELGRSGQGYQLCYNIKAVADKGDQVREDERWSIRQAALHHQFDVEKGTALWICTEGRKDGGLWHRLRDMTTDPMRKEDWTYGTVEEGFRSSLATHLVSCHWAYENWEAYMRWLEDKVENTTRVAVSGNRKLGKDEFRKKYAPDDLQSVQDLEEKISEVVMVLEANDDIMKSLSDFYVNMMRNDDLDQTLRTSCADDVREFAAEVVNLRYDTGLELRRAKALGKITRDRKGLILQHLQGQASEATLELTRLSTREATIMRIITIVTLVFLPATFASTLFSTDIVKYQGQDGTSFSQEAMFRWLQVTLPLSALTLGVGYAWYRYQTAKSERKYILPFQNGSQ